VQESVQEIDWQI